MANDEERSVEKFREYLRIKSAPPNPDYYGCIKWLKVQAGELNLQLNIVEFPAPAEFAVIMSMKGKNSSLKSIMLNSHIDVVPADESNWTHDPWAAEKDASGNIFGRGTQDMKSVGVQYLEAIRKLKDKGFVPLRDIHVVFVPDEELGGRKGMAEFVKTDVFKNLNVGLGLDEGITSPDEEFILSYAERAICQVKFTAKGNTGHSLFLHENTAAEKIQKVVNKLLSVRESEKRRLKSDPDLGLGDVNSINMTMLQGGVQINVVPESIQVSFDLRITPSFSAVEVKELLNDVSEEAGPDVSYEILLETLDYTAQTLLNDENVWWSTFKSTCDNMGLKLKPSVFPGTTDSRYVRQQGIPCFGFSPINNTPVLLHSNDEFLNEATFLRGIDIYESLIWNLANIPK